MLDTARNLSVPLTSHPEDILLTPDSWMADSYPVADILRTIDTMYLVKVGRCFMF